MLLTRLQLEQKEALNLASYAVKSAESQGRTFYEKPDTYRTAFQRDRDRVIHSKAFRRSKGKTQVFIAHYGDHYRSRMVHAIEVAQISRAIARNLGLNEDLAEVIALAHDLGHTPFGHAGEEELNRILNQYGGHFEHNEQSLRIVEKLEYRYADFVGLNLSYEVKDGLIKHRTAYDHPHSIDHPMASLEAQVVNLGDEIAYQNHDIDDGLRSGLIHIDDLNDLEIWQKAQKNIRQDLGEDVFVASTVTSLIKLMIEDVLNQTQLNLKNSKVSQLKQVYESTASLVRFSPEIQAINDELKKFLYSHLYHSRGVTKYNKQGQRVIRRLFDYYMQHFNKITLDLRADSSEPQYILVKDYIAGMTDNFALEFFNKL